VDLFFFFWQLLKWDYKIFCANNEVRFGTEWDIGLVQQPGWLFHKSRRFGEFLAETRQIYCFSAEVVQ
jgi:hypothetical protein